jgi:hypothetical protein
MTLAVEEFLRRFLLHLLPPGFVRIRNFGFLANRNRATLLPLCFQLLSGSERMAAPATSSLTRLTRSGTVRYAEEPCTWSNDSLPRSSCFALRLNQNGALHEALSASSAYDRASAHMEIPRLISKKLFPKEPLHPLHQGLLGLCNAPSRPKSGRHYPSSGLF